MADASTPAPSTEKPWHAYTTDDIKRVLLESKDSAVESARSLHQNPPLHFRMLKDALPRVTSQYRAYEDAFFKKIKDELTIARDHPTAACGVAGAAALLLLGAPRRFLFRQTFGRFQSVEAQFLKAEKNVKEFRLSVDLMKNESKKLLERAALAEDDMRKGHAKLKNAGSEIKRHIKSICKIESETADLMETLRAISGRDAIRMRAEVATMASFLKEQRASQEKRILKISDMGVSV